MDNDKTCNNCKYRGMDIDGERQNSCHRYPPMHSIAGFMHPKVKSKEGVSDWCGEWAPRDD